MDEPAHQRTALKKDASPRQGLSVAVVIPTKNRPDDLDITIQTLLAQTVLPQQVIIVDQSADEESKLRVKARFAAVLPTLAEAIELRYVHDVTITGLTAARNRALAEGRADTVLFLDDDVVLEENFIEEIVNVYSQYPNATGVSGVVVNYSPPPLLLRYWTRLFSRGPFHDDRQPIYWNFRDLLHHAPLRVTRFGGGLMSFRMAAIAGVRFDENLSGACAGEDVDFCMRLPSSAVLLIAPKARLIHKQTPVARSDSHWLYLHARTNWYLYRKNWSGGIFNRLCCAWLNIGYGLAAVVSSVHRRSAFPLKHLVEAVHDSRKLVGTYTSRMDY